MGISRLRLPRSRRIKRQRDFGLVRQRGRRLSCGVLALNWLALPAGSPCRVGIIAGRKIGKAHVRNRARRLLRESFRRHQQSLVKAVAVVLVARSSIVGKGLAEVEADFLAALRRSGLIKGAG